MWPFLPRPVVGSTLHPSCAIRPEVAAAKEMKAEAKAVVRGRVIPTAAADAKRCADALEVLRDWLPVTR
jgi:hypothetical protein